MCVPAAPQVKAPPAPPTTQDPSVVMARLASQKRLRAAAGRESTLLTSPTGSAEYGTTSQGKTMLGA